MYNGQIEVFNLTLILFEINLTYPEYAVIDSGSPKVVPTFSPLRELNFLLILCFAL